MNAKRGVSSGGASRLARLVRRRLSVGWQVVAILGIGLMLSILASLVLPAGIAEAAPCTECAEASDPVQYSALAARAEEARSVLSPAAGPEYWASRSGMAAADEAEIGRSVLSPAAGPEFLVGRVRDAASQLTRGSVASDSPLKGPEFWLSRSGSASAGPAGGALSRSPAVGPEFWAARSTGNLADCVAWSDALARFHRAKRIEDPANGAMSLGEAEFYVARYGADGAAIVMLEDGMSTVLCEA